MAESNELIVIEKASVHDVFTKADKLDPIIAQIRAMVSSVVPDTTTAKGRAEIKSRAYQVTRTKTYLDGLGKDLVAEMKKLPAIVDASRKRVRDELDTLAEQVRKPLSDWEAEQERLAAEQRAREEAEIMAKRIEADWELALLMNEKFDRDKADAKEREAREAREREERMVQAAREAAKRAAAAEVEAAQRREKEALEAAERAEQARKDAEARAELERKLSAEREEKARKDAEAKAEQARQSAIAEERRQQETDRQRAEQERQKREADMEHRAKINREVLADLMTAGLTEDQAKAVICAVVKNKVRHTAITY